MMVVKRVQCSVIKNKKKKKGKGSELFHSPDRRILYSEDNVALLNKGQPALMVLYIFLL